MATRREIRNPESGIQNSSWTTGGLCLLPALVVPFIGAFYGLCLLGILAGLALIVFFPFATLILFALYAPFEALIIYRFPLNLYLVAKHGGTAFTGVLAVILISRAVFLHQAGIRRLRFHPIPPGLFSLFAFAFWIYLSAMANGTEGYLAFKMLVQEARFIPLYFGLAVYAPGRRTIHRILIALFVAVLVQVGLGVTQIIFGEPVGTALAAPQVESEEGTIYAGGSNINTLSAGRIRIAGSTGSYNTFGVYLSLYVLLLVCFLYATWDRLGAWRFHLILLLLVGLTLIVFTYSRMALAGILAGTFATGWLRRDWRMGVLLLCVVGIIVILFIYDQTDYSKFRDQGDITWVQKVKSSVTPERLETSRNAGRLGVSLYALDLSFAHPFFGVGPGYWGNILALTDNEHTRHVMLVKNIPFVYSYLQDNNWTSTLGQIGWPGTVAFLSIFIAVFWRGRRAYLRVREPWLRFMSLSVMVVTLGYVVLGLFAPNFVIRVIAFNYWVLMGTFLGGLRSPEAQSSIAGGPTAE